VVEELAALDNDRSALRLGKTGLATAGAELLGGQVLGLLLGGFFEGPGGQASGGLLHSVEIDVEAGPLIAEGTSDNDFAPLFGQGVDVGEVLVVELTRSHTASLMQLAPMRGSALSS
jgi:hypothetical protein